MELNFVDFVVLAGVLLLNLIVGLSLARRASRGTTDFYLAGRSLPWWLLGTSMVATTFALDTPLVIAEFIVNGGLFENWLWISFALSHLFVTFLLAPQWRRSGAVTDVELCERRYDGRPAAFLRGLKSLFFALILNGLALSGVFRAVRALCEGFGYGETMIWGWGLPEVILVVALLLTLAYSASAGLWGVVTTDAFQFALAIFGAVVVAWAALSHPKVGGLSGLRDGIETLTIQRRLAQAHFPGDSALGFAMAEGRKEAPLSLAPAGLGQASPKRTRFQIGGARFDDRGIELLVFFLVLWWAWKFSDGGGVLIQRILAARDEKQAVLGTLWFCCAHYALRWWPWAITGLCAMLIFAGGPLEGTTAYARTVSVVVPAGWRGLVLAYFLAAFMSTVDTHIQLASSYLVNDLYRRFLKPEASERHYVWVGRGSTVAVLLLAILGAQVWGSFKQLYLVVLNLVSGAGVVFLLRWFWWRINAWSEISALISSLLLGGGLSVLGPLGFGWLDWPPWASTLLTVFGSACIWLPVTFLTAPTRSETLERFYREVRPFGFWGPQQGVLGPELTSSALYPVIAWLVSVLGVYALLFLGRGLLAEAWRESFVAAIIAASCAASLVWLLPKILGEAIRAGGDSSATPVDQAEALNEC